jgi:2-polyprenyl-3-methyl-5-hydroxy-6-metoxy-1,4-benzoquinol methylase
MSPGDEEAHFAFGENWARFLRTVGEDRIVEAERSLVEFVGPDAISGRSWLDIGSGSGLFSLAAARLGAARLHSFDYDAASVACTRALRERYGSDDGRWTVERGDVLDPEYVAALGQFDVVYSWGVLHHTGDLWTAFAEAARTVAPGGLLFVAIYNDRGWRSRAWRAVKRGYNRLPPRLRLAYTLLVMGPRELATLAWDTIHLRPLDYPRRWTRYQSARGMSRWHDIVDWVGGYPFEVATPAAVVTRAQALGLAQEHFVPGPGGACNQFVFRRA